MKGFLAKPFSLAQINNACRDGRKVRALIGKRRVRIMGAVSRGRDKHFAAGMVWVNLWGGSGEWKQVRVGSVTIDG